MRNDTLQNLEEIFQPYLKNTAFLEILDLVKQNSMGKIWIIGGFVYRNLAAALYGGNAYNYDIDFIVEERSESLKKISGWNIEINNYGVPNYVRIGNRMSFTDIKKVRRAVPLEKFTIEEIITGTPLNIQSIAYGLSEYRIIGEKGIEALRNKVIRINNKEQAEFYAKRKSKDLGDIVIEKAKELGFNYELPGTDNPHDIFYIPENLTVTQTKNGLK